MVTEALLAAELNFHAGFPDQLLVLRVLVKLNAHQVPSVATHGLSLTGVDYKRVVSLCSQFPVSSPMLETNLVPLLQLW